MLYLDFTACACVLFELLDRNGEAENFSGSLALTIIVEIGLPFSRPPPLLSVTEMGDTLEMLSPLFQLAMENG